jgi:hypothetical protein
MYLKYLPFVSRDIPDLMVLLALLVHLGLL